MPYKSKAQMRMMHAKHPDIAKRWDAEMKAKHQTMKGKPEHVAKRTHHSSSPKKG